MTYRPINPFDRLIQQFLENTTRTADATERGLQAQREERLIGEERAEQRAVMQQQRDWQRSDLEWQRANQVADYQKERDDQLTDQAETYRMGLLARMQELGMYVTPDDPMYGEFQAMLGALGRPTGLTGEAAREFIYSGKFTTDVDGTPTNINVYDILSRANISKNDTVRDEGWQDVLLNNAVTNMLNTSLPEATRLGWGNVVVGADFFDEDTKNMFLQAVGVGDPEQRARILRQDRMDEADLTQKELNIAVTATQLGQMIARFGWEEDWHTWDWDKRQERYEMEVEAHRHPIDMSDAELFLTAGLLPPAGPRRERLANAQGISMEQLEARARTHLMRWQRNENLTTKALEQSLELTGVQMDGQRIINAQAQFNLDRDYVFTVLDDKMAVADAAMAAALAGDTGKLEMLRGLSETPLFEEALEHLEFDGLLSLAGEVFVDAADARAYNRQVLETNRNQLMRGEVTNFEVFLDGVASRFMDSDFTPGPDGTFPVLESEIRTWVNGLRLKDITDLGATSADDLVDRLVERAWVERSKQNRSEAVARLESLLEVPWPEDAGMARQHKAAIADAMLLTGVYEEEDVPGFLAGLEDDETRTRHRSEAETREIYQRADYTYAQTLSELYETGQLMQGGEGGGEMSLDAFIDMKAMATEAFTSARDMVNGDFCKVSEQTGEFNQGGFSFRTDEPVCVDAARRMEEWSVTLAWLAAGGIDAMTGAVTVPAPPSEVPGSQTPAGTASAPNRMVLRQAITASGQDPDSLNWDIYAVLDPEAQAGVASMIASGIPIEGADGINAELMQALVESDSAQGFIAKPTGLPPLADAGIDVNSREWRTSSIEDRVSALSGTSEWMNLVTDIANGQVSLFTVTQGENGPVESLIRSKAEALARQYGFMSPRSLLGITAESVGNAIGATAQAIGDAYRGNPWQGSVRDAPLDAVDRLYPNTDQLLQALESSVVTAREQNTARMQQEALDRQRQAQWSVPGETMGPSAEPPSQPAQATPAASTEQAGTMVGGQFVPMMPGVQPATARGSGLDPSAMRLGAPSQPTPTTPASPIDQLTVSQTALQELRNAEGFSERAYQDAGGVWTVGFGQTGPHVTEGTTMTREQADEAMRSHLAGVENTIKSTVTVPLTQNQYDALASLIYNIGGPAFRRSNVLAKLNSGDIVGAADAFLEHHKGGGQDGLLTPRRERERLKFLSDFQARGR